MCNNQGICNNSECREHFLLCLLRCLIPSNLTYDILQQIPLWLDPDCNLTIPLPSPSSPVPPPTTRGHSSECMIYMMLTFIIVSVDSTCRDGAETPISLNKSNGSGLPNVCL